MLKVGIMGGTFDPIHVGHLIAAQSALEAAGLDEVWFVPSYAPPLKDHAPGADGLARLEMTMLATEPEPRFRVLDMELRRGGVSYSVDTARELASRHPRHEFAYIIGSDRVNDLAKWHRIEELAASVRFIGLERPGEPLPDPSALPSFLQRRIEFAPMPHIDISSTDIRARATSGLSIRYYVPDSVYFYIQRNGLYES
ncbi:nicotinate-nucleotide adenylyltransferase [Paenibacillus methanolicus]|uniref:Probable nicotinate-nucleotide adenylyltransferase n=1 Tax=Paenibacillus methanolicus TaxID=582686 RepID=A0A5S5CF79_9BACL|nr:nicotinate-nucleotide adenylyltransferase [Paenibacillus methanolicus]TYP78061.1 nicotinate-nucleotide adenylyltransferase [Paenibacillus methanolicus]